MMPSNRSYLLRMVYDRIVASHLTPYILLDTQFPHVEVPSQYFKDSKITLNISPNAILNLKIDNTAIQFEASFNGYSTLIYAPIQAVLIIYARENGQGIEFTKNDEDNGESSLPPPRVRPGTKPKLSIVK